ncbi:MAG: SusD/RagB family nutrient-binding outer membrane lipoprotein [Chitinophagaceae bacterium]|nr:SusD/RagB family nutrient-binding outer membrane lipoprotein [Chitinophagaceae bacterium]
MKFNKNILFLLVTMVITFGSCKKFLREEFNDDPTSQNDPIPSLLLPAAQANIAYYLGGDVARYTALMTQQVSGAGNQWIAYDNYIYTNSDFTNLWNGWYTSGLNSLDKAGKYANANKMAHYEAACKILSGYTYATLVDLYNDIPFTEALQGPEILQPKYDAGSSVYSGVHALLDAGIALANQVDAGKVPGADDLMFGGDMNKWIEFAHATKARMYLHTKEYAKASAEIILANGIDAELVFQSPSSNPISQFIDQRYGDINFYGTTFSNLMEANGDARVYSILDTSDASWLGLLSNPQAPISFINSVELKFIEAEIAARNGDATAGDVLNEAVAMSYMKVLGDTAGMAAAMSGMPYNVWDALEDRLKVVMTQKYFAMFMQPETFADWRRTGYPVLTPVAGSNIPRRFLYPQDETNNNPNTPSGTTLYSKVFWDN